MPEFPADELKNPDAAIEVLRRVLVAKDALARDVDEVRVVSVDNFRLVFVVWAVKVLIDFEFDTAVARSVVV